MFWLLVVVALVLNPVATLVLLGNVRRAIGVLVNSLLNVLIAVISLSGERMELAISPSNERNKLPLIPS